MLQYPVGMTPIPSDQRLDQQHDDLLAGRADGLLGRAVEPGQGRGRPCDRPEGADPRRTPSRWPDRVDPPVGQPWVRDRSLISSMFLEVGRVAPGHDPEDAPRVEPGSKLDTSTIPSIWSDPPRGQPPGGRSAPFAGRSPEVPGVAAGIRCPPGRRPTPCWPPGAVRRRPPTIGKAPGDRRERSGYRPARGNPSAQPEPAVMPSVTAQPPVTSSPVYAGPTPPTLEPVMPCTTTPEPPRRRLRTGRPAPLLPEPTSPPVLATPEPVVPVRSLPSRPCRQSRRRQRRSCPVLPRSCPSQACRRSRTGLHRSFPALLRPARADRPNPKRQSFPALHRSARSRPPQPAASRSYLLRSFRNESDRPLPVVPGPAPILPEPVSPSTEAIERLVIGAGPTPPGIGPSNARRGRSRVPRSPVRRLELGSVEAPIWPAPAPVEPAPPPFLPRRQDRLLDPVRKRMESGRGRRPDQTGQGPLLPRHQGRGRGWRRDHHRGAGHRRRRTRWEMTSGRREADMSSLERQQLYQSEISRRLDPLQDRSIRAPVPVQPRRCSRIRKLKAGDR